MSCAFSVEAAQRGKGGTPTLSNGRWHELPLRWLRIEPGPPDSDGEAFIAQVRGLDIRWRGHELSKVLGPRVNDGEASLTHVRGPGVGCGGHELSNSLR